MSSKAKGSSASSSLEKALKDLREVTKMESDLEISLIRESMREEAAFSKRKDCVSNCRESRKKAIEKSAENLEKLEKAMNALKSILNQLKVSRYDEFNETDTGKSKKAQCISKCEELTKPRSKHRAGNPILEETTLEKSRVKNVSLSKDGTSLSLYSNFFSKKFKKTETTYISADREACIYNFKMKEDAYGPITITGCKNEVREMSIFPANSPPFFSKIRPNGKVEEIVLPPIKDEIIFPEHLPNNKTKESGGKNVNNEKQTSTPAQGSDKDHQANTKSSDELAKHDKGGQTKHRDRNKKSSTSTKESVEKPVDRSSEKIGKRGRQRTDNEKQTTSTPAQGSDKDHQSNTKASDELAKPDKGGQTKHGDRNKKSSTSTKESVEKPAQKPVDRSSERIGKRGRQRTDNEKQTNSTPAQGSNKDQQANTKASDELAKHDKGGQSKNGDENKKSSTGTKQSVKKPAQKPVNRSAERIDKRRRQRTDKGKIHNADSLVSQEANSEDERPIQKSELKNTNSD